jgi:hypothetical protein
VRTREVFRFTLVGLILLFMGLASQPLRSQEPMTMDFYPSAVNGNPPGSARRLFTNSATGKLSVRTAGGATISLEEQGGAGGGLPSGAIVLSLTTCPTGFTEEASLSGKFVLGTVAGAGDVGTMGGSDTVTSVLNHTHTVNVTDPQHNHTQNAHTHVVTSQTATTGSATSYEHGVLDTSSAEAEATEVTGSTTATNVAAATGITASTANPAGGVASIDNRPAFLRVIFCRAD